MDSNNQFDRNGQNNTGPQQDPAGAPMSGQPDFSRQPNYATYPPMAEPAAAPNPAAPAQNSPRRWSTGAVAALLLAGAVLAGGTTAVVMQSQDSGYSSENTSFNRNNSNVSEDRPATPAEDGTVEAVAQKVLPSVVSIRVQSMQGGGEGSGSIISNDGLIMTNNHVVEGADRAGAKIEVLTNDGRTLAAHVVATEPSSDVAVIKADGANDLVPIAIGNSEDVQVGQSVVAVGSPLGLTSTVTSGIVSAKNRPVQAAGEQGGEASLIDAIQTDAAINPGNSGGALVNMNGELVGIPSVIASTSTGEQAGSIGLGFAIPSNQAEKIARQLIDNGEVKNPIIGAQVNTRSEMVGAELVAINEGSPAEEAGLKAGDVVTKVDDRVVESGVGLIAAIRSYNVGDKITLTVRNGDDERTVDLTLGSD